MLNALHSKDQGEETPMPIKLYDSKVSPYARKVRLVVAELDIPIEKISLDFQKGDPQKPEYLALNPNGKVPTIDDEGFVLWESIAILKYLAGKKPGLLPSDARGAAQADQWMYWWANHPEPAIELLIYELALKPFFGKPGNNASIIQEARDLLDRYLPVLDKQLHGKEFVLGKLSIVDFAIAPPLELSQRRLNVDLAKYPDITAWLARLQAKPYWKTA
jgi:glutathione S-transferase